MTILVAPLQPVYAHLAQVRSPAQPMTAQAALERLFTNQQVQTNWFAPEFLSAIPVSPQQVIDSIKQELGAYQGVQADGGDYLVLFERGAVPTKIVLNPQGQISGLLFQPPQAKLSNLDEAVAGFKALPGKASLLVMKGKLERAALNASTPLAVGSAFKLAVLQALKSQVEIGQKSWGEVVELKAAWKSLPSGFLQTWPEGSRLTVHSLAALMISQSDNTATDALIHLVSPKQIEALTPRNQPFLTTRQAFVLKGSKNRELLERYRQGDAVKRRSLLTETANYSLPEVSEFEGTPIALDVEWFFTAQELCHLMAEVQSLPLMRINPGVARASDWERVAFKGGSEPGVLNLTTWLQAKTGKHYCVSATWNHNIPLEEFRFIALYNGILEVLKVD